MSDDCLRSESNTCVRGCCRSSSIRLSMPKSSITLLSPISKGSESIVYEALLEGVKVAAKKPILTTTEDMDRFHKELQILCRIDHPSVAKLVAAHAKPPDYMFFFPFYEIGNLAQALHVKEWNPPVKTILTISLQLAQALRYLHDMGIVHRDVKPANILLDEKLRAHLADFGLAEYAKVLENTTVQNWKSIGKPTGGFHKKNMVGTLIYMAPEVLKKEMQTEKSDIYSFAITINELITGVVPYTDRRTEAQAHTVLEMNYSEQQLTAAITSDGLRPVLGDSELGIPHALLSLIELCWRGNPAERPSSDALIEKLEEIIFDYSDHALKNQNSTRVLLEHEDANPIYMTTTHQNQDNISWSSQGALSAQNLQSSVSLKMWLQPSNVQDMYHPILSWGSFATCGRRETMEDAHFISPQLGNENHIFSCGIFDGHRGTEAAEFSANAMPRILHSAASCKSPSEALANAFITTDKLFRSVLDNQRSTAKERCKSRHPGCTAAVALIVENRLFVANAGDCRTILCRKGHPVALSKDHVASCTDERKRVLRAGGDVKWQIDTWRVGSAALQVTRSIGDDDLKPAVTAEPEITETFLSIDDEYMVMASDGLWDKLTNEEVLSLIKDTVKEPNMCSKRLATEAIEKGSNDNITVIVIFLRPVSTVERIY